MGISADTLVRGYQFDGVTGLKTGANLEDLATRATLANASELLDQVTLETYLCPTLAVYRARLKDGAVTAAKIAAGAVGSSQLATGAVTAAKVAAGGAIPPALDTQTFHMYRASPAYNTTGYAEKVYLDTDWWDYNNCTDLANSRFVAKVQGVYHLDALVTLAAFGSSVVTQAQIRKNGSPCINGEYTTNSAAHANHASGCVKLAVGDYVELWILRSSATAQSVSMGVEVTFLDGFLVATY